ncbi:unnamed protein product [Callosobruchus maculatus]|uniref:Suppressor APC domain-containing protein n=1 Tax=Callosobruchus maculatus TaxID=64391 RepID=A0A653BG46_CALMS|nr:unnamed protein product [Callosobruchus maculatus]
MVPGGTLLIDATADRAQNAAHSSPFTCSAGGGTDSDRSLSVAAAVPPRYWVPASVPPRPSAHAIREHRAMSIPLSPTPDGLPKQFVVAMRTLFDIMDDKRTGYVNIADIENRWQEDNTKGLPKGVIESLRKVTPPNGMLSFDRFCAGLKICLLKNQVEKRDVKSPEVKTSRPPSAPLLDIDTPPKAQNWCNTAAVRPNVISQQRTLSMPQLLPDSRKDNLESYEKPVSPVNKGFEVGNVNKPSLYGPPKPPRSAIGLDRPGLGLDRPGVCLDRPPLGLERPPIGPDRPMNIDRAEIRTALQNWQMGLQEKTNDKLKAQQQQQQQQFAGPLLRTSRSLGDGKPAAQPESVQVSSVSVQAPQVYPQKKPNVRRREPRRHTLQNGIDYNMLKRMKQIEQEKEVLMQGLSAVEKAREWYLKQVAAVQEKMKYLGRMGHVEHWSEAQQERIELQRARVLEVNRHLAALTESWERGGLPLHMNLAVHHFPLPMQQDMTDRLKQQNRLLTEEVSKKSERIAALEREKTNLLQILQHRSANTARSNVSEEAVF